MGAVHPEDDTTARTPKTVRFTLYLLVPVAIATAIAMAVMWPTDAPAAKNAPGSTQVTGEVVGVSQRQCPESETPGGAQPERCGLANVELTSGKDSGSIVSTPVPNGNGVPEVAEGDSVILLHIQEAESTYSIIDEDRSVPLWMMGIAFALAVVAFGRIRGLLSLIGLAVTFAVLLLFIVPAILAGQSPLMVAIVGSAAIMLTVLYLTHGFRATTTIAVAGTLSALVLTGLLSALAVNVAHLTGISDENTTQISMFHDVNTQGLLLAGILIGSLGALDDVTVTQASAVTELARANPQYGVGELYSAAARIGRSHIASVVNTIILAYAGAALPLMILIGAADQPLGQTLTHQLIAEEIVRSIVGTIGLIAAVPLTTLLASLTVRKFSPAAGEFGEQHKPGPRPLLDKDEWLKFHGDSEDESPAARP